MSTSFDSVEVQIREARERAEIFAASLKKAREQEAHFEKERQRWVQTFEEKSIIIEQLERELESTVEALNEERLQEKVGAPSASAASVPAPRTSALLAATNGLQAPVDQYAGLQHVSSASSRQMEMSNMLELLQQTQEETNRAKRETATIRAENDRMQEQISSMKRHIDRLTEDRDQLVTACRNADGKLQFRSEQILNYESEKEEMLRREGELMKQIADLQKQLAAERSELLVVSADLRAANIHNSRLEQRIIDLANQVHVAAPVGVGVAAEGTGGDPVATSTSTNINTTSAVAIHESASATSVSASSLASELELRQREEYWSKRLEEERRHHQAEQSMADDMIHKLQRRLEEVEDTCRDLKSRVATADSDIRRVVGLSDHAAAALEGHIQRRSGGDKKAPIHRWQHHKGEADAFSSDEDEDDGLVDEHDLHATHEHVHGRTHGHAASVLEMDTSVDSGHYQYDEQEHEHGEEVEHRNLKHHTPSAKGKKAHKTKEASVGVRASAESVGTAASKLSKASTRVSETSARRSHESMGDYKTTGKSGHMKHQGDDGEYVDHDDNHDDHAELNDSRGDVSMSTIGLGSATMAAVKVSKTRKATKRPSSAPATGRVAGKSRTSGTTPTAGTTTKSTTSTSRTTVPASVTDIVVGRSIHSVPAIKRGRTVPAFPAAPTPSAQARARSLAAGAATASPAPASSAVKTKLNGRTPSSAVSPAARGLSSSAAGGAIKSTKKKTSKAPVKSINNASDADAAKKHPSRDDILHKLNEEDSGRMYGGDDDYLHQQFLRPYEGTHNQSQSRDDDHSRGSRDSQGRSHATDGSRPRSEPHNNMGEGHHPHPHTQSLKKSKSSADAHDVDVSNTAAGKALHYKSKVSSSSSAISKVTADSSVASVDSRVRRHEIPDGRQIPNHDSLDASLASLSTASDELVQPDIEHTATGRTVMSKRKVAKSKATKSNVVGSTTKRAASVERRTAERSEVSGRSRSGSLVRSASPASPRPLSAPPAGRRAPSNDVSHLSRSRTPPATTRLSSPTLGRAASSLSRLASSVGIAIPRKSETFKQHSSPSRRPK